MPEWEAPAKLNLDLRVGAADATGKHPLRSLVQAIEWCDILTVEAGDEDHLEVVGGPEDFVEEGDNLVWRAVTALDLKGRPPLNVRLEKHVAVAAGLGGGSSDAAAMLFAVRDLLGFRQDRLLEVAPMVGSDVAFFLTGGTAVIEGYGERVTAVPGLGGFAVAVAVPRFEMSTPEVYGRWDALDGPLGDETPSGALPPSLRAEGRFRNDLAPAALAVRPELADWMSDLARRWGRPVMMSGSGPACFAYFVDEDEARSAVGEVGEQRAATAASLRPRGVSPREY